MLSESSNTSDAYGTERPRKRRLRHVKRRKASTGRAVSVTDSVPVVSFTPLLNQIPHGEHSESESSYEQFMDVLLPEYLRDRAVLQEHASERDESGQTIRPLTRHEVSSFIESSRSDQPLSVSQVIAIRKLKLERERRRSNFPGTDVVISPGHITPLPPSPSPLPVNPHVIDALYSIRTTPFENSFLSRLNGARAPKIPGLITVDWETTSPWMNLMSDVRAHYGLAHPERDQPTETLAPITYTSLQAYHLEQVHDLLARVFWAGIDVSDSLEYSPERCTIVATYKLLVVGVAILSSPQETYITYLAVKAGWDNAQIATSMLYHLITLNPNKDVTLHVSVNNSAMLLYNRFGFKAEEFVAGFYEDYLDPQSRASKNAFRLRLRQQ